LKDRHVLITGHTGFKGSWLVAMLESQGARVSGVALDPVAGGIFQSAELENLLVHDLRQDIRDSVELTRAFQKVSPDVVFHLAAQPLVLNSYEIPEETYETNVMGTLNVLKAAEATSSVQATVIVTTDKVYRQVPGEEHAFQETDALGAADPYSTSKAMADLLTQSWIASHPQSRIGIARAGNVIGGGDVAENRLLPDLVKAFRDGQTAIVRNPNSVRPWQHVLDCLAGYVLLAEGLLSGNAENGAYNFGPDPDSPLRVAEVTDIAEAVWGAAARWITEEQFQPHESEFLTLDSTKSKSVLGWKEKLSSAEAVKWSVEWSRDHSSGKQAKDLTLQQLAEFDSR
jgi:CDP-glucose 4,6-dehydratase